MPPRKSTSNKKVKEKVAVVKKEKAKSLLFDFLSQITLTKDLNYLNNLSEQDAKQFSPFILQRFLSMDEELLPLVNVLNRYTFSFDNKTLPKKLYYDIMVRLVPRERRFLKYIKSDKESYPLFLLEKVSALYCCSIDEAHEMMKLLVKTGEFSDYIDGFGFETKQITQLNKIYLSIGSDSEELEE